MRKEAGAFFLATFASWHHPLRQTQVLEFAAENIVRRVFFNIRVQV